MRGQRHVPTASYPGEIPVPIVQEAGWASGPVWTGAENFFPSGIQSPDRPASSQSLYQLSYPAHTNKCACINIFTHLYIRLYTYTHIYCTHVHLLVLLHKFKYSFNARIFTINPTRSDVTRTWEGTLPWILEK
jgi:hypothetical protein